MRLTRREVYRKFGGCLSGDLFSSISVLQIFGRPENKRTQKIKNKEKRHIECAFSAFYTGIYLYIKKIKNLKERGDVTGFLTFFRFQNKGVDLFFENYRRRERLGNFLLFKNIFRGICGKIFLSVTVMILPESGFLREIFAWG